MKRITAIAFVRTFILLVIALVYHPFCSDFYFSHTRLSLVEFSI